MTEVKNFNQMLLLMESVVDDNRAVDKLTHPRPVASGAPHTGEIRLSKST